MSHWEQAECVRINLENLATTVPGLNFNPMYQITHMQISDLCKELSPMLEKQP